MLPDEANIRFERLPTDGDSGQGWDVIRANPEHPTPLTIVSTDLFGVRTHYHRGRTGPCLRTGCEACQEGKLSRWHGYLFAVRSANSERVILEYTPPAVVALEAAFKEYGKLRGLNIIASRTSNRNNAKVTVAVKGMSPNAHKLPREPLMWPTLCKIWGLRAEGFPEFSEFSNPDKAPAEHAEETPVSSAAPLEDYISRQRALDLAGQLPLPLNGRAKT